MFSYYEDLYPLVKFIPSFHLPSGIPPPSATDNPVGRARRLFRPPSVSTVDPTDSVQNDAESIKHLLALDKEFTTPLPLRPKLRPAREPPVFQWSETFPIRYFVSKRHRLKVARRRALARQRQFDYESRGGQNIPLEITRFMSTWVAEMSKRKTTDNGALGALVKSLEIMGEALASLERILTTPIPWSYNAHIKTVTYIYCLLLPFQLYGAGFGFITIPAVMVSPTAPYSLPRMTLIKSDYYLYRGGLCRDRDRD